MSEKSDLNRINEKQNDLSEANQNNHQPIDHTFKQQQFQDTNQYQNDTCHMSNQSRSQQETKRQYQQHQVREISNENKILDIQVLQGHKQNKIIENFDQFQDANEEQQENHTENDFQFENNHQIEVKSVRNNQLNKNSEASQAQIQVQQPKQKQALNVPHQNLKNNEIKEDSIIQEKNIPINEDNKVAQDQINKPQQAKNQAEQLQRSISTEKQSKSSIAQQIRPSIHKIQRQRFQKAFSIFSKYNIQYQKIVGSYRLILKNVRSQIKVRQQNKSKSESFLVQYFETYIKMNKQFHQRSYKIQKQASSSQSTNKFLNIKQELKEGFERLFYMRKTLADEMNKLQNYITSYTIKSIHEAFEIYKRLQSIQSKKQDDILDDYESSEKKFQKMYSSLQKLFKKCMNSQKTKEDIFVLMAKYVKQQEEYRKILIAYGKSSIQLRKTFIIGQKQLLFTLQRIINEFKLQSRRVYAAKKQDFLVFDNYVQQVERQSSYQSLCTITDVDYIKSILHLQNRNQPVSLNDQHYIQYLQLPFLDGIVGDKQELLDMCYLKTFPLLLKDEKLVHSISGNLVQYHSQNHECKQKYSIRNITVCQIKQGILEFDELVKGLVFSQNRRVSLKFSSNSIAQQFVIYLNQQQAERLRLQF